MLRLISWFKSIPSWPPQKIRRILIWVIVALGFILIAYGILRWQLGEFLPKHFDIDLPNAIIILALFIFLWNRQLYKKEQLYRDEAAAKKAIAKEKALGPETEAEPTQVRKE